jgi:hypothetical protein
VFTNSITPLKNGDAAPLKDGVEIAFKNACITAKEYIGLRSSLNTVLYKYRTRQSVPLYQISIFYLPPQGGCKARSVNSIALSATVICNATGVKTP